MVNAATKTRGSILTREQTYSSKYVVWMCALLFALIMGRAVSDIFLPVFAVVGFLVFAVSSVKHCIPLLLFLLPFSTILKPDVDSISVFTIFSLLVVVKMILFGRRINVWMLVFGLLFFGYGLLVSGFGELTTLITMVSGLFMVYYAGKEKMDVGSVVLAYSAGICLAAVLAIFMESFPLVNELVIKTTLKLGQEYTTRFSGLIGNPNYYTLDIIVAMSAIVVLMCNRKSTKLHIAFLIALTLLGLMSVSKSFLVALICLAVCWLVVSVRQGVGRLGVFIFVIVIGMAAAYYFAYDHINMYLLRFMEDESGSLGSITTGRSDLWLAYFNAILSDLKTFLFGNGLNVILESVQKGAHNTYLESLFSLGIIGTGLFLAAIKASIGKITWKGSCWILAFILMIRMFAIGILTYDNLWFYLLVYVLLMKLQNDKSEDITEV